jgi:hypothetical protein
MKLPRLSPAIVLLSVLLSCQSVDEPRQSLALGSYLLESVSGRGPSLGTIVLLPGGQVGRSVRYARPDGTLSAEYVAVGTFRVNGDATIEFSLRENGGASNYVWKVPATFKDGVLSLSYPDPADGWIVENYRHQ